MNELFRIIDPKADIEISEKSRPPIKNVDWCIFHTLKHLTEWKQISNIR